MRIVIDLQGAQSGSFNRGIGRYTLSLVKAILGHHNDHEIIIALNGFFSESIDTIRKALGEWLPKENIQIWMPLRSASWIANYTWCRQASELLREAFLASLKPDVILISSLFEGHTDNTVTSIGQLGNTVPTAVIFYDLIPFIYSDTYLRALSDQAWYQEKLTFLKRADLLLTISESSSQEALKYLNVSSNKISCISSAADPMFCPYVITEARTQRLRKRYNLADRYIMYTGGSDHRKNIDNLIYAYASLPNSLRQIYQLVVVCSIKTHDHYALQTLAASAGVEENQFILTGFVEDEELIELYNLCEAFVFPSKHEGFGLPVLEAMQCGCAVIASNTSSLPEVLGCEEALFDPYDVDSIANKLKQVLLDDTFRKSLEAHAILQSAKFSWSKSSKKAIAALELLVENHLSLPDTLHEKPIKKLRLAYVLLFPGERSDVSHYNVELLSEIACYYDIDVIFEQNSVSDTWVKANCRQYSMEWFSQHANFYDRVIYHVATPIFSQRALDLIEQISGVVVLHDFYFSHMPDDKSLNNLSSLYWGKVLYDSYGYLAVYNRFQSKDIDDILWKYPCNIALLQYIQGIIVHSRYSLSLLNYWYGGDINHHCRYIPFFENSFFGFDKIESRRALGFSDNDFIICNFSFLEHSEQDHRILNAWLNSSLAHDSDCLFVLMGKNFKEGCRENLLASIDDNKLRSRIRIVDWLNQKVFHQHMSAVGVVIYLSTGSRDETADGLLDYISYGLPIVTNSYHSIGDITNDRIIKLADNFTDDQLIKALDELWRNDESRQKVDKSDQLVIDTEHVSNIYADQYVAAIEQFYQNHDASVPSLVSAIGKLESKIKDQAALPQLAQAIDCSIKPIICQRQLFVDISELVKSEVSKSTQTMVCNVLHQWLLNPPCHYRVEPVYATTEHQGYYYARNFTLKLLNCFSDGLVDTPISYRPNDKFIGLSLSITTACSQRLFYQNLHRRGVMVKFFVYDMQFMELFDKSLSQASGLLKKWFDVMIDASGVIFASEIVAIRLLDLLKNHLTEADKQLAIDFFEGEYATDFVKIIHSQLGDCEISQDSWLHDRARCSVSEAADRLLEAMRYSSFLNGNHSPHRLTTG